MTAGKALTSITNELKNQEKNIKNWPNEIDQKLFFAGAIYDEAVSAAVEHHAEIEIEKKVVATIAALMRILKEMK